jgi:hypothetical protein
MTPFKRPLLCALFFTLSVMGCSDAAGPDTAQDTGPTDAGLGDAVTSEAADAGPPDAQGLTDADALAEVPDGLSLGDAAPDTSSPETVAEALTVVVAEGCPTLVMTSDDGARVLFALPLYDGELVLPYSSQVAELWVLDVPTGIQTMVTDRAMVGYHHPTDFARLSPGGDRVLWTAAPEVIPVDPAEWDALHETEVLLFDLTSEESTLVAQGLSAFSGRFDVLMAFAVATPDDALGTVAEASAGAAQIWRYDGETIYRTAETDPVMGGFGLHRHVAGDAPVILADGVMVAHPDNAEAPGVVIYQGVVDNVPRVYVLDLETETSWLLPLEVHPMVKVGSLSADRQWLYLLDTSVTEELWRVGLGADALSVELVDVGVNKLTVRATAFGVLYDKSAAFMRYERFAWTSATGSVQLAPESCQGVVMDLDRRVAAFAVEGCSTGTSRGFVVVDLETGALLMEGQTYRDTAFALRGDRLVYPRPVVGEEAEETTALEAAITEVDLTTGEETALEDGWFNLAGTSEGYVIFVNQQDILAPTALVRWRPSLGVDLLSDSAGTRRVWTSPAWLTWMTPPVDGVCALRAEPMGAEPMGAEPDPAVPEPGS